MLIMVLLLMLMRTQTLSWVVRSEMVSGTCNRVRIKVDVRGDDEAGSGAGYDDGNR